MAPTVADYSANRLLSHTAMPAPLPDPSGSEAATFTLPRPLRFTSLGDLHRSAVLVLHTILFHRIFGTITPASVSVSFASSSSSASASGSGSGGVGSEEAEERLFSSSHDFPIVAESYVVDLVKQSADDVVERAKSSERHRAQLVVSLCSSVKSEPKSADGATGTAAAATTRPYAGWLAQAFAGGIGGGGAAGVPQETASSAEGSTEAQRSPHTQPSPAAAAKAVVPTIDLLQRSPDLGAFQPEPSSSRRTNVDCFEHWVIDFELQSSSTSSRRSSSGGSIIGGLGGTDSSSSGAVNEKPKPTTSTSSSFSSQQLQEQQILDFVERTLAFVDANRDGIPPILSADMCPFPTFVNVL